MALGVEGRREQGRRAPTMHLADEIHHLRVELLVDEVRDLQEGFIHQRYPGESASNFP